MASCLGVGVSLFGGSVQRNRASLVRERERSCSSIGKGNGRLKSKGEEKKIKLRNDVPEKLEPFWDDGYGTMTLKDYFAAVKEFTRHRDGGPPRWFCPVASGCPLKGSPILLFLPGNDFAPADKFKTDIKFINMEWLRHKF